MISFTNRHYRRRSAQNIYMHIDLCLYAYTSVLKIKYLKSYINFISFNDFIHEPTLSKEERPEEQ